MSSAFIAQLQTLASSKALTSFSSDKKRSESAVVFIKESMTTIIKTLKSKYDSNDIKKVYALVNKMFDKMDKYLSDEKEIKKIVKQFERTFNQCAKELKKEEKNNSKCPVCKGSCASQRSSLECGHWVHIQCVVRSGCNCCPVCNTKVKLSVTNQKKCESAKKTKTTLLKQEKKLEKAVETEINKFKELGYFTCSESDCSCNNISECCSDSNCDCSSSSDDSSSSSSDESSSSSEDEIKVDYEKGFLTAYNRLQSITDNDKIKKIIPLVKNVYNKMNTKQQEKYITEFELLKLM